MADNKMLLSLCVSSVVAAIMKRRQKKTKKPHNLDALIKY